MSTSLVRLALEFVDQEESSGKLGKRRAATRRRITAGQEHLPYSKRNKKVNLVPSKCQESTAEENICKLLALSSHTTDTNIAGKIVERAIKGKPLIEKLEEKTDDGKSILFADQEEPYSKFEREYFCS